MKTKLEEIMFRRKEKKLLKIGFKSYNYNILKTKHNFKFELPCQYTGSIEYAISFGCYSFVNGYLTVRCELEVGRFCSIGAGVSIGMHNHPIDRESTSPFFYIKDFLGFENDFEIEPFNNISKKIFDVKER